MKANIRQTAGNISDGVRGAYHTVVADADRLADLVTTMGLSEAYPLGYVEAHCNAIPKNTAGRVGRVAGEFIFYGPVLIGLSYLLSQM